MAAGESPHSEKMPCISVETVTLPPLLVRILLLKLNSLPPYKVGLDFVDWLIVLQKP